LRLRLLGEEAGPRGQQDECERGGESAKLPVHNVHFNKSSEVDCEK
jgi:hypothetical protein